MRGMNQSIGVGDAAQEMRRSADLPACAECAAHSHNLILEHCKVDDRAVGIRVIEVFPFEEGSILLQVGTPHVGLQLHDLVSQFGPIWDDFVSASRHAHHVIP